MPTIDLGGNTLIVKDVQVGSSTPGSTGTSLSSTELSYVDGVTAGTALASKAVVLGASKEIATITTATITNLTTTTLTPTTIAGGTFSTTPVLGAGTTIDLDSTTATLSSNAATITKYACVVTTESLTTASGASQALVITLTGLVAAGDLAFVQAAGGSNTRKNYFYEAVTTSNTVTVTVYNNHASALNGTLIFNLWVLKA